MKVTFTQREKTILSRAAEIELAHLEHIAQSKHSITNIKELLKHPDTREPQIPDEKLEITMEIMEIMETFEKFKENPDTLFQMPISHVDLVTLILVEYFEDEWADDDDVEFAALCHKIILLTDLIEENPINYN